MNQSQSKPSIHDHDLVSVPAESICFVLRTAFSEPAASRHQSAKAEQRLQIKARMPFRGSYIDTTTPRALPLLQQVYRKLRPVDLGAAARWSLLAGVTAFWLIEPYDWLRSTFMSDVNGEKSPKLK